MTEVGRVAALWRYPVKSMAGEPVDEADVSWHGFAGDRRWAFVQERLVRSDFPWLTIRERDDMVRFRASLVDPSRPDKSPVVVRTPEGEELDVADPRLAEVLGGGVRALKQNRGAFDSAPLSLIGSRSLMAMTQYAGRELDPRRFRPNLLVEAGDAYAEETWVGRTLQIGGMRMRVDRRDSRCVIVNVDPDWVFRDPTVLRAIALTHDGCLGVYGTTVEPGRVAVGDAVLLPTLG